jgi:glycosyltransferase involved in cell wall biosynthesis
MEAALPSYRDKSTGQSTARQVVASLTDLGLVEVVVPAYNEERHLEASIRKLDKHLRHLPVRWRVVIADNGSTDRTWEVATRLAQAMPGISARHLNRKGRGLALRTVWTESDADVLCYMDVDLSTNLDCFLPLVAPLLSGHSHIAIGSRLMAGARVNRGLKREILSRGYNRLLTWVLRVGFSDAQCGFKAIRAQTARELLPLVRDDEWFFDTELLALAERRGLRIFEVPVTWQDDPDSRVDIPRTVLQDLRGIVRLRLAFWGRGRPFAAGHID